jgi:Fe-S oxidoreductase
MNTTTTDKTIQVDTKIIKEKLGALKGGRFKEWLKMCAHCGYCADSCFYYQAHNKDPKFMPAYKLISALGKLYKKNGEISRSELEEIAEIAYTKCTACRRCSMYCPFGIDIATMMAATRMICNTQGLAPEGLKTAIKNYYETGNQMGIEQDEFIKTCEWVAEEASEEMPGLQIPVDKQGADLMYTLGAREVKFYPQDISEAALILHETGENWTLPSMGWDDTNLALFAGDMKCAAHVVKLVYDAAERLGAKKIGVTECGHAYRALKFEGPYWLGLPGGKPPVPVCHAVELYADYIKSGRIKIDPEKILQEPVTYHDACNISRNGGLMEEARYLMNMLSKDFRDMTPNREYNHCCGGGGGYIAMGTSFKKKRMEAGRVKAEQIRETGAKYVVTSCHNCFDQIKDLSKEYNLGVEVIQFKSLVTRAMVRTRTSKSKDAHAA